MIKSVQKALKILNILSNSNISPVPLYEIAEKTGIAKPTCSHLISTLEEEGYVVKISSSKGYILGPSAYYLSRYGRYKSELIAICRPIMEHIANESGFSVVLAVIEGSKKYIIDYIDDGTIFDVKANIIEDNIYVSATGKAILTNLSDLEIYNIFKKNGMPTDIELHDTTSLKELMEKISENKKQQIIKSRIPNEKLGFVNLGYGASLYDSKGCVAAIGIAIKLSFEQEKDFINNDEERIRKLLEKGAKEITRRLTYK